MMKKLYNIAEKKRDMNYSPEAVCIFQAWKLL